MRLKAPDLGTAIAGGAAATPAFHLIAWVAGLAVSAFGTWVLFAARPGLNAFLWTTLAAAGYGWSARAGGQPGSRPRTLLLVLGSVLAGGIAVTADPLLQLLVVPCVGMIAAILTLHSAGDRLSELGLPGLLAAPWKAVAAGLRSFAGQLRALMRRARAERSVPVLRGLLLALPVVTVFFLLLSAAEPTMAAWRDTVCDALIALSFLPRTVFFVVLAVATIGVLALGGQLPAAGAAAAGRPARHAATLHDVERLIVIGAIAALFAVFLVLQHAFLFGNPGGRSGSGVTYADAVHRGFWELTVAAGLCLLLTLALDQLARHGTRERAVRLATFILIAEAALLLASAWYRVAVYEAAYGYTFQRLYAQAHTLLIGLSLLLLAREVAVGIDARRLIRRMGLLAALALGVFCYWNHAAWIADANIARWRNTGNLDVQYLVYGLGDDALPEVIAQLPALSTPLADGVRIRLAGLQAQRAANAPAHWYEWNLRRAAADRALRALPALAAVP